MASITHSSTRFGAPATASGLRTRLLKSSTFRLTLVYLSVFGVSVLALLGFIYVSASSFMERQTIETIEAEIQGLREQFDRDRLAGLVRVIEQRSSHDTDKLGVYLLVDWNDRVLAGNIPRWPNTGVQADGTLRFDMPRRTEDGYTPKHAIVARSFVINNAFRLLVGRDVEDKVKTLETIRNAILLGSLFMLGFGVVGGYATARFTLRRIARINRTTAEVVAGNLGKRIAVDGGGGDEFDELATNLNAMLERLERLLAGMREVTDNIAHDLRTPLSRMISRIEVALLHDPDAAEAREILDATLRDAEGLMETFNALLHIANAEAGAQQSAWERFDLSEVARDVFDLYEPLAEERSIELSLDLEEPVPVLGNRQLIAQAVANVTDNAIKYTPEGGTVRISTRTSPTPKVCVADNGPGIPPELYEKALQRLVRLDPDRTKPGNGLGLSLVAAVARLHEAKLELADNEPGLRVTLSFKPLPPNG